MRIIAIGLIIFLLCVSVAGASATEKEADLSIISAEDLGYQIIPAKDFSSNLIITKLDSGLDSGLVSTTSLFTDTITQGETNWHYFNVNTYYTTMHVDLNWGDTTDSLKLYIYDPEYHCIGYFYDTSDGYRDGRINLYVYNPDGIEQGTWRYRVYGYYVIGTEDYSM